MATDWTMTRHRLWLRSRGRCEMTGLQLAGQPVEVHHRRFRSRGGDDAMENLLLVLAKAHRWAHANNRLASEYGWNVSQWADPALVPVVVLVPEGWR